MHVIFIGGFVYIVFIKISLETKEIIFSWSDVLLSHKKQNDKLLIVGFFEVCRSRTRLEF